MITKSTVRNCPRLLRTQPTVSVEVGRVPPGVVVAPDLILTCGRAGDPDGELGVTCRVVQNCKLAEKSYEIMQLRKERSVIKSRRSIRFRSLTCHIRSDYRAATCLTCS
jgi:hypothetical protein